MSIYVSVIGYVWCHQYRVEFNQVKNLYNQAYYFTLPFFHSDIGTDNPGDPILCSYFIIRLYTQHHHIRHTDHYSVHLMLTLI